MAKSEYSHITIPIQDIVDLSKLTTKHIKVQNENIRRQLGYILEEYFVNIENEEQIKKRLLLHYKEFQKLPGRDIIKTSLDLRNLQASTTILQGCEKDIRDLVSFMLHTYSSLDEKERNKVSLHLSRAARIGIDTENILRKTDSLVWRRCMLLFLKDNKLELAEKCSKDIIRVNPEDSQAYLTLSKILNKQNRKHEALEEAKNAAKVQKPTAEALTYLGRLLIKSEPENISSLHEYTNQALLIDPKYAIAYWLRARIFLLENKYQEAFESILVSLELDPNNTNSRKLHQNILNNLKI